MDLASAIAGMHELLLAPGNAASEAVTLIPGEGAPVETVCHRGRDRTDEEQEDGGAIRRRRSCTLRIATGVPLRPGDAVELGGERWSVEAAEGPRAGKLLVDVLRVETVNAAAARARRGR